MSTPSTGRPAACARKPSAPSRARGRTRAVSRRPPADRAPRSAAAPRRTGFRAARGSPAAAATSRRGARGGTAHRLRATQISSAGHCRGPLGRDEVVEARAAPHRREPGARSGPRSSKPLPRSKRIQSPCARWNSTPTSSGHSNRYMPNCGRCRRSSTCPVSGRAENDERRVAQEDQPAAGTQQPRRLRHPEVRIGPDRGAVLRDGEVERRVRQRHPLAGCLDQREHDPRLLLHPPGRLELRGRRVDADRARAELGEPRREVRGPAAELDDVEPRNVAERARPPPPGCPTAPR